VSWQRRAHSGSHSGPGAISRSSPFSLAHCRMPMKSCLGNCSRRTWNNRKTCLSSLRTFATGETNRAPWARVLTFNASRGTRFSYTFYYPKEPPADGIRLDRGGLHKTSIDYPIHKSITALDHEAMDITGAISQDNKVHQQFSQYLTRTKNTICGRHPIGVLLAAMESVDEPLELRWVRYAQSSACMSVRDSSVSYASGYVSARV
jgi:hypothetical protein